jgi:hypothetical protein
MRGHYDAQLATRPDGRPQRMSTRRMSQPPPSPRAGAGPRALPLDEAVRSSAARPFARRAEELIRKGDLRQAKLQLVMANHRDPGNAILEAALRDIESRLR